MNKSIDLLYDNINNGYLAILDKSVLNDYFGNQINPANNEIIYGVYEFTNMSLFTNWYLLTAIIDTTWGAILFGLTTGLVYKLESFF